MMKILITGGAGFIDDDVRKRKRKIQGYKVLGGRDDLAAVVMKYNVQEIIVASESIRPENRGFW